MIQILRKHFFPLGPKVGCWGLFVLGLCPPLMATSDSLSTKIEINASVDRSAITIGDRIHYSIEVTYPQGGRVSLPSVLGNLGAFEVKDYKTSESQAKDGRKIEKHLFEISTFTVGPYTLPPQQVEVRFGQDTTPLILYTQPTGIQVNRTSPENVKDIADIDEVVDLPRKIPWLPIALAFGVLAIVGYLLWIKYERKAGQVKEIPLLSPHEEALKNLTALNAIQHLRQNRAREFAFALSEILRNYVGRRYTIDALESTTPEFLERIKPLDLSVSQQDWIRGLCETLDQTKYATGGILESDAELWIQETKKFVERTKVVPETLPRNEVKPQ